MVSRRLFLRDLGRGSLAVLVLGIAGCGDEQTAGPDTGQASTTAAPSASTATSAPSSTTTSAADTTAEQPQASWHRVNLGFVSAYLLVRSGEAAVVDTGVEGSAGDIEQALASAGLGWESVGHVILTHRHPDHVGSLPAVLEGATGAEAYAGEADIPAIASPRPLTPLVDGDRVFDLDMIATPGHTAGHIAVLDTTMGVLVAGDALTGEGGSVAGPNPDFSSDHAMAIESVRKLAGYDYETVLFGHGEPVDRGGSEQVAELARTL